MLILKFKLNNSNCNYNLIDKACLLGDNHVFQKNKQANLQYFFLPLAVIRGPRCHLNLVAGECDQDTT